MYAKVHEVAYLCTTVNQNKLSCYSLDSSLNVDDFEERHLSIVLQALKIAARSETDINLQNSKIIISAPLLQFNMVPEQTD